MITINHDRIDQVAEIIKQMPNANCGMNFYSTRAGDREIVLDDMYPALHQQGAIDFFFFVCLHQFGFWYGDLFGYCEPLFGQIDGIMVKGSDLLWRVCLKALNKDPETFTPLALADISPDQLFREVFTDDNGPIPFPDLEVRLQITQAYGKYLLDYGKTPPMYVDRANQFSNSLGVFRSLMLGVPGFNEDYIVKFSKKIELLAMVLTNRPEKFLKTDEEDRWMPIVDYHVMRVALRLGLVDVDPEIEQILVSRRWIDSRVEDKIRWQIANAVDELIQKSGKSMFFVDELLWQARNYCPEMEAPDCASCILNSVCAQRTRLFQPVLRTINY